MADELLASGFEGAVHGREGLLGGAHHPRGGVESRRRSLARGRPKYRKVHGGGPELELPDFLDVVLGGVAVDWEGRLVGALLGIPRVEVVLRDGGLRDNAGHSGDSGKAFQ